MTEEEIKKKYEYMFKLADKNNTGGLIYPISFGIECEEGWYPLVFRLIEDIARLDKNKQVKIHQIKEKFGTLRCYFDGCTDEMYKLITEAEEKSATICEKCGAKGKIRNDLSWIRTLCNKCYIVENPMKLFEFARISLP